MASSSSENLKGVASWTNPCRAALFPAKHSIIIAMVILLGKPWGLKMMSGMTPLSVQGRSSHTHFWLQIPFWPKKRWWSVEERKEETSSEFKIDILPALEANLSPTFIFRGIRNDMQTRLLLPVPIQCQKSWKNNWNIFLSDYNKAKLYLPNSLLHNLILSTKQVSFPSNFLTTKTPSESFL